MFGRTNWAWVVVGSAAAGAVIASLFFLSLLGWPWDSPLAAGAAAAGAVVGAAVGSFRYYRERKFAGELAALCEHIGFAFEPYPERKDLGPLLELPLLANCSDAYNRMSSRGEGLPVAMLDVVSREGGTASSAGPGGSEGRTVRRTVVAFPAREKALPDVSLSPSDWGQALFGTLTGMRGITFRAEGDGAAVVEQFHKHYVLWPTRWGPGRPEGDPADEEAVRRAFTPEALKFFAENPGWHGQAQGGRLLLWRGARPVPAGERPALVARALEVYQALTRGEDVAAAPRAAGPQVTVTAAQFDTKAMQVRFRALGTGVVLGAFLGGLAGMAGAMLLATNEPDPPVGLMAAVLFGGFLLGGAAGGWLGYRAGLARARRLAAANPGTPVPGSPNASAGFPQT
jgi:hypothetical protein